MNQGLRFYNDTSTGGDTALTLKNSGGVDSLEFQVNGAEYTVWHTGNLAAGDLNSIYGYTAANSAKQIIAGNGLTGGGTLAADRTLTLGTPGGHYQHDDKLRHVYQPHPCPRVYCGGGLYWNNSGQRKLSRRNYTADGSERGNVRNSEVTPCLYSTNSFVESGYPGAGTTLAGTWRVRGNVASQDWQIVQRTA
ncbi:hypothetical protein Q1M64_27090 [Sinorhizobium meliloti]|nr:hypothetical protein Q1M64_27090 [Sinorhizobium meliloti]